MARRSSYGLLLLFIAACPATVLAQIEFDDHIQDQMVVQRGMRWEISGTSSNHVSFDATFADKTVKVHPVAGQWKAEFHVPSNLSGLAELNIDEGRLIRKIQVGDIWLCSGQSNMAMSVGGAYKNKITRSLLGKTIKIFQVRKPMNIPQPNASRWVDGSSSDASAFSAVCLAFGAALYERTRIPIGLIDGTLGGTWIESWISPQSFKLASSAQAAISRYDKAAEHRKRKGLRTETYGIEKPSQLFELMIAPLGQQGIKGVLWYQGEGSGGISNNYAELLSLLIRDWRALWNNPALPFVVMQLPRFGTPSAGLDTRSGWAMIRDAQRIAVSSSQPAGLVVSIDLGDGTIHPPDKLPFGKRAANIAFELVYDKGHEHLMPMPTHFDVRDDAVRIEFDKGEACVEGTPHLSDTVFIAGEDHRWHNAEVDVERSSISARSPKVLHPVAIRYAWSDYPLVGLQTCESEIPITPFHADARQ